jgi:predicted NBD/HSP70 family sugar kinase
MTADATSTHDLRIGVDVGGTTTRVVAVDATDRVVDVSTSATPHGATALLDHLEARIVALAARVGGNGTPVPGPVGLGLPGRVLPDGSVSMALNLRIDEPIPVGPLLAARLGVPVVVENDVNAAALGAATVLGDAVPAGLAYLSVGTGFAAGIVLDGRLVRGATGSAGELGHVPAPGSDVACRCGQRGCVEARVSGGALVARTAGLGGLHARELWDAADAGHELAGTVRDDAVATLAWACQVAVTVLDVDVVLLGGGVAGLGVRLLRPVVDELRRREATAPLLAALAPSARTRLAPDGIELGALGAAVAAGGGRRRAVVA